MSTTAADIVKVLPVAGALAAAIYLVMKAINCKSGNKSSCCSDCKCKVNQSLYKDQEKVASKVTMEEIGEKAAFCRCWRSSKFPYCDGSHTKHNQETGDNVGPLIIAKKGD